jgi:iron(II)-dependent oxidoreductase
MKFLMLILLAAAAPPLRAEAPIEWAAIDGGTFKMGFKKGWGDEVPVHKVKVKAFEMSKTVVTVEQYAACVAKGRCTRPSPGDPQRSFCNWEVPGRERHPINCVSWEQANAYAAFVGARLPTESEWEYAAKSGGKDRKYPWGSEPGSCDKAVVRGPYGDGCGTGAMMPVCSRPAGNTDQGLCDMAGNIRQFVQDTYQDSYKSAPADGSAFEAAGDCRVARGSTFEAGFGGLLRNDCRSRWCPDNRVLGGFGIRLARSGH